MQSTLSLGLVACLSEDGFSLDELVVCVKELFEKDGMAGVVGLVLGLVEEELVMRMVRNGAIVASGAVLRVGDGEQLQRVEERTPCDANTPRRRSRNRAACGRFPARSRGR